MEQKNYYRCIIHHLIDFIKGKEEVSSSAEREALWQDIVNDVQKEKRLIWKYRLQFIAKATSVAAVLGAVVWFGTQKLFTQQSDIIDVASQIIASNTMNEDEIRLVVSNSKVITLNKGATVAYSSNGSVTIDDEAVTEATHEEIYNQLIVPKGKFIHLVLSDGSSVYVNAGTKVVYPRQFKGNLREIFVDGEVYIDVKRNEAAPFFVKTNRFEVEVLGTAFNVNAYSEDKYSEVTLVRGSVSVKDHLKKKMALEPNQSVSLNSGEITRKRTVDASEYILWTQGVLRCNAEPLGNLLRRLQRYYGIEITYDPAVESLLINGSIDLICPLAEVLRRISITAPMKYHQSANGYTVTKSNE